MTAFGCEKTRKNVVGDMRGGDLHFCTCRKKEKQASCT